MEPQPPRGSTLLSGDMDSPDFQKMNLWKKKSVAAGEAFCNLLEENPIKFKITTNLTFEYEYIFVVNSSLLHTLS